MGLPHGPADLFQGFAPSAFAIGDVAGDGFERVGAVGEQFERVHLLEEAPFEFLGLLEAVESLGGDADQKSFIIGGGFVMLREILAQSADRIEHRRLAGGLCRWSHFPPS